MAAHDLVEIGADLLKKQPELDPLVAPDIRTGRASRAEFLHRGRDHPLLVFRLERHDIERNAGLLANGAGMFEVFLPGATPQVGQFVFEPDLQVKGVDVPKARLLHQAQGHGTVHAARQ